MNARVAANSRAFTASTLTGREPSPGDLAALIPVGHGDSGADPRLDLSGCGARKWLQAVKVDVLPPSVRQSELTPTSEIRHTSPFVAAERLLEDHSLAAPPVRFGIPPRSFLHESMVSQFLTQTLYTTYE